MCPQQAKRDSWPDPERHIAYGEANRTTDADPENEPSRPELRGDGSHPAWARAPCSGRRPESAA